MTEPIKSVDSFLPYGEMLRGFIEQSIVPKGALSNLLQSRGVFLGSNEKSATIPVLISSLLSSDEFDRLRESVSRREDSQKRFTRSISFNSEDPLITCIPDGIQDGLSSEFEFANFKISKTGQFFPVEGNPDHVRLEFEVERVDTTKNWSQSKNLFPGTVDMKRVDDGDSVKLSITYTAKETQSVARKTVSRAIEHFKKTGQMDASGEMKRVLFSDFSNSDRISFLLSLTVGCKSSILDFVDVVDMAIAPTSDTGNLPEPMRWLEERVKDFRCKGSELHRTALVGDPNCHEFVELYRLDADFRVDVRGVVGECQISFSFPKYGSKRDVDSELEVTISKLNISSGVMAMSQTALKNLLLDDVENQIATLAQHFSSPCHVSTT